MNLTITITVDATPEAAFAAITNVRGWWSGAIDGPTDQLGGEFTYRYQDVHYSKQKVTELVPGRRVAWLVLDSYLAFIENKQEWNGSQVTFDIARKGSKTEIRFTHAGLVPAHECYDACSNAWGSYIRGSLRSLIETGAGQPNPGSATRSRIAGAVALVTGANRGLGKAIVSALLEAGAAKVYAAARDERAIATDDPRVVPLRLDVTNPEQIAAAAKTAGDVTLLVNNAGVLSSRNVLTATQADIDADFRVQVHGMLGVVRAFVPVLERAPAGATIVNVLSLASLASFPALGGYSASKAAAYSVTQALRPELKKKRIDILAALPGPIDTEMVRDLPMPKTSADDTAKALLAGIARGDEEIFPDPMAIQMGPLWHTSPKEYERAFASF